MFALGEGLASGAASAAACCPFGGCASSCRPQTAITFRNGKIADMRATGSCAVAGARAAAAALPCGATAWAAGGRSWRPPFTQHPEVTGALTSCLSASAYVV